MYLENFAETVTNDPLKIKMIENNKVFVRIMNELIVDPVSYQSFQSHILIEAINIIAEIFYTKFLNIN